jgi:hypothetical protein
MRVRRLHLVIGLRPRAERTHHHEVLARVDDRIRLGLELIEVLRDPREDVVRNALRALKGALGRSSAARLTPLDLRVEGL